MVYPLPPQVRDWGEGPYAACLEYPNLISAAKNTLPYRRHPCYNNNMKLEQEEKILVQLEKLNEQLTKHHTLRHFFMTGVMYGTGFFVGSAILATIALGLLGPVFGHVSWVRNAYEQGTAIRQQR